MRLFKKKLDEAEYLEQLFLDDYNKEHCGILRGLKKILLQYNSYKDYDKIIAEANEKVKIARKKCSRFKSEKRLLDLFQAELNRAFIKEEHDNTDIVELEKKLAEYEKYLDRKYWNMYLIDKMLIAININMCKTIEEAVELLGKEKEL